MRLTGQEEGIPLPPLRPTSSSCGNRRSGLGEKGGEVVGELGVIAAVREGGIAWRPDMFICWRGDLWAACAGARAARGMTSPSGAACGHAFLDGCLGLPHGETASEIKKQNVK